MGDNEMIDLANLVNEKNKTNLQLSGTLINKRAQLEAYFTKNMPTHARTEMGHLMFNCVFDPNGPRRIGSLSTIELKALMESYKLSKPSYLSTGRKDLQKHVQKQFLKKYPKTPIVDGQIVFGRVDKPPANSKPNTSTQN